MVLEQAFVGVEELHGTVWLVFDGAKLRELRLNYKHEDFPSQLDQDLLKIGFDSPLIPPDEPHFEWEKQQYQERLKIWEERRKEYSPHSLDMSGHLSVEETVETEMRAKESGLTILTDTREFLIQSPPERIIYEARSPNPNPDLTIVDLKVLDSVGKKKAIDELIETLITQSENNPEKIKWDRIAIDYHDDDRQRAMFSICYNALLWGGRIGHGFELDKALEIQAFFNERRYRTTISANKAKFEEKEGYVLIQ